MLRLCIKYLRTSISSRVFKSSGFQGQSSPSLAIRVVLRGIATVELSATTMATGNEKISKPERAAHFDGSHHYSGVSHRTFGFRTKEFDTVRPFNQRMRSHKTFSSESEKIRTQSLERFQSGTIGSRLNSMEI